MQLNEPLNYLSSSLFTIGVLTVVTYLLNLPTTNTSSIKPTHLQRDTVSGWLVNEANFKKAHEGIIDTDIAKWVGFI
jgi:hypothetical protein